MAPSHHPRLIPSPFRLGNLENSGVIFLINPSTINKWRYHFWPTNGSDLFHISRCREHSSTQQAFLAATTAKPWAPEHAKRQQPLASWKLLAS